jgi:hypothetical protein
MAGDTFRGDSAANLFQGGAGQDTYFLGAGRDLVDIDRITESPVGAGRDVVLDFLAGTDRLDLAGVDADTTIAGDQAFRFVGTAAHGDTPGVIGFFVSGDNTIVRGGTDTDGTPEFQIQLSGFVPLSVEDFYL